MGNQLAGIAPSQILSVDSYFSDIHDHEYDKSLGSTRFFKVARAKHREGLVVVKVFAIQDPSLPLTSYKQELEELKIRLHSCQNCLPFQKTSLTEKAAILFRQFVRDNLYDRISTRPFLNNVEKRWIAFQILTAVDQAHKAGVRHGDIKTENVMVTGWNWVLLTDFASFKPTYLPEDNPADFNYFFDTSRRRTCYIAPERFVDGSMFTTESDQNTPLVDLTSSNQRSRGELRPAMDIFSAGTDPTREAEARRPGWMLNGNVCVCVCSRLRDRRAFHRGRPALRPVPAAGLPQGTLPGRAGPAEDRGPEHPRAGRHGPVLIPYRPGVEGLTGFQAGPSGLIQGQRSHQHA